MRHPYRDISHRGYRGRIQEIKLSSTVYPDFGALVISLDFELHWGVRDKKHVNGPYRANLEGVWEAVPRMLETFREFEVAATWATVGLLFADSREQAQTYSPLLKPDYRDGRLYPYGQEVGSSEDDDPFHYAPSLIERIRRCPRQEIGTHTFSHYYCCEPGQDSSSFEQDLLSAISLARVKGIEPKSIVFPRNQHNPRYDKILCDAGIICYRGNQRSWIYEPGSSAESNRVLKRLGRLTDHYLNLAGYHTTKWSEVVQGNRCLCNVPASFYLRPFSPRLKNLEFLRLRRIEQSMRYAATRKELVHIWWHPHDFGIYIDENIAFLRKVLALYKQLHQAHGLESLSMEKVARSVLRYVY
jgi:peptidoglycan/xylan/chitin deacetylase (PgdA/CDA1 family)